MIAALFVERGGAYFNMPNVDPWDKERDARLYAGPWPVVAHPPCERWGRYWYGGPMLHKLGRRKQRGDDNGCFAAAILAVRTYGGVLEHPEASAAWDTFEVVKPYKDGGWIPGDSLGWTCSVEQGWYGHRSRKATWLYYAGRERPPELRWGRAPGEFMIIEDSYRSTEQRRKAVKLGVISRLTHRERAATPIPFRDVLISLAESSAMRDRRLL
jgi:hypothetical protein